MSIEEEKIVMPGERLGIIEQYLPGEGTYDEDGEIKSSVMGNVKINKKSKIISVDSRLGHPALLKVGDIVYGQITDIKSQRATLTIQCLKDNSRPLALPYIASIHISKAKMGYLDKLFDAYRIGDIIQAKVVNISGDNVDLSTTPRDCGVIKGMCTRCRSYMKTFRRKNELICPNCKKKERRKVSVNYLND